MNYAEVVNDTNGNANFEVKYLLGGKSIAETSPTIEPSRIRRIELPHDAELITIDIFIIYPDGKTKQIFHDSFNESKQSCYEIKGSFKNPTCSKISCSSIKSTDWIYVKNKGLYAPIKFEALYIIDGVGYKDESSILKPTKGGGLVIPRNAGRVQLKVYMEDIHAPVETFDVIYLEYFYHPFNVCFDVNGLLPYPFCEKVPCPKSDNNGNNPPECQYCCHCCCHMCNGNFIPQYTEKLSQ
ncbi:hypothetical protein IRP63_01915 [Clostridium botulinum]|uniref:Uncharacterized protein n=1 Tax=Clostridium botulinum C/D str. DC5 TaxID=1443128 RepID=A0A0A0IF81_CLOBO|nr:hypothetical protein [Clostridium botulinum]KEI05598.1 hypothetical protein Z952_05140 [Clostridium botulinum C/D str. BKT75002]KEI09647.1 hypothetical protein Z954_11810 [Clostridium botulinum C/D str. BKT2873]KGM95192.1 hypothetical protein Z956_05495 [Clostridium botulinum D str. CCUG 7971]KGM98956.1 hypothetical protein Z955_09630 [Clostridium botulinum C/D str. DC5]KOC55441.1 hypothetical protein ADU89_05315 [Clostridium botulinum]